jgi:hypothetical protein
MASWSEGVGRGCRSFKSTFPATSVCVSGEQETNKIINKRRTVFFMAIFFLVNVANWTGNVQ